MRTRNTMDIQQAYHHEYKAHDTMQFGGVAQVSINQGAHQIVKQGKDWSGLGRWVWVTYQGKQGISITVLTGYHPVLNKSGPTLVWNQHSEYFVEKGNEECPRHIFTKDVGLQIKELLATGTQLIVGLDVNEDVHTGAFCTDMKGLGLTKIITTKHANAPPTYDRGQKPLDGIFVSASLVNCQCGYLPFYFDHRGIWINVPDTLAFGHKLATSMKPSARRLKCQDPRIMKKYLIEFKAKLQRAPLLEWANNLYATITGPLREQQQTEWEMIDQLRVEAMLAAEWKCRHIFSGEINWTPTFALIESLIHLWNLMVKMLRGGKVKRKYLKRKAKKVGMLETITTCTLEQALSF